MTTVPSHGGLPPPQPGAREITSSRGSAAGPELVAPSSARQHWLPSCYRFGQVICDLAGKANTDFIWLSGRGDWGRKGI